MAKKTIQEAVNEWLAKRTKEEGVKTLSEGVYYKVLAEGDQSGVTPTPHSIVSFHYKGTNFNGMEFCNSRRGGKPYSARLCALYKGWIIALSQMHKGDKWEVYIPSEIGFHEFKRWWGYTEVPLYGILTFEFEIISIR